ncbi:glycosyltransferase family 1 protein [Paenibacillus sp. UNC451MF]|uniref:glycosyltransferase family 1 protein n=1 Tax=Paenibacillus sp. UNC451MF TaxID=1449063 RepID=UPI00048AE8CA|nr:glycosyltransferase family 1 protein [Paenibacillus sp. UNC451MF]
MGDPVRILHVVVNMNRGGAETLLMNMYRNIDRTQIQFDFLTCKEGIFDSEITAMGGRVHRIPYLTEVGHSKYIQALNQFFVSHPEYRIVHSHMDKMSGFVLRSAKKAGVPTRIAHSHNTSSEGGFAARMYKWAAGSFIRPSSTHFIACSLKAAEWLFPGRKDQAAILKNGIEYEKFLFNQEVRVQVRRELEIPEASCVVGHVGRFNHQKNHAFLIDIFAQLHADTPNTNTVLVLAGDGPLRPEMEKKVRECKLEGKVKFLGVRSDIARLLQAFDTFVFPSLHEGLPVTLIEAQGAGLPCIISDVITQEVDMGMELVDYISLDQPTTWVQAIKRRIAKPTSRHIPANSLTERGYDIRTTARWVEDYYLTMTR